MKKAVMLSVATLLAFSAVATSQAQENPQAPEAKAEAAAPAEAPAADAKAAETADAKDAQAAEGAAPADGAVPAEGEAAKEEAKPAPVEEAPKDSPQVAKLVAMYPNLIARIAPYGKVCFDGEECDINITVLAPAVEGQARDGESLYKAICSTCHDAGVLGAPKFGDAGAWAPRIGKGKAALYNSAINGFNAMPARGGADISDEEVHNAVDYIISKSS